jgi:regulator of sigma E protease
MSVLYFLILVGVLVAIHELGHFLAARALGIRVLRFSLGFGPALARFVGRDTEYRLGCIPLGGYVRLLGEDPAEAVPEAERPRAFSARPLRHRLIVVFAGPAANLLCPLVIYFFFFLGHSEVPAAVVGDILPDSPAAAAGLEPGDVILAIDDQPVRTWEELQASIDRGVDHSLLVTYTRTGREHSTYVTPRRSVLRQRDGRERSHGMVGITQTPLPPRIGVVDEASPAARAGLRTGDLIISIDGHAVDSWTVLSRRLREYHQRIQLAYLRPRRAPLGFAEITTSTAALADVIPHFETTASGDRKITTGLASAEFFVARVDADSPAARAGLLPGDLLVALDDQPLTSWLRFDQALQASPEVSHRLRWQRGRPGGGVLELDAELKQDRLDLLDEYGHARPVLQLGLGNDDAPGTPAMVAVDGRFTYALSHAWRRTGQTIREVASGFASLLRGEVPADGVGGPIMMYRIASVSGQKGWDYFLLMIALISVNLGLINLLPIPVLDGGHLVMFAIEGLSRRKLSPRLRDAVLFAGLVVIVGMTVLALRNDVMRYVLS